MGEGRRKSKNSAKLKGFQGKFDFRTKSDGVHVHTAAVIKTLCVAKPKQYKPYPASRRTMLRG